MRFGQWIKLVFAYVIIFASCQDAQKSYIGFAAPVEGLNVKLGSSFEVSLDLKNPSEVNKIDYYVEDKLVASLNKYQPIILKTDGYGLGFKTIKAIISTTKSADTITSNIVVFSNVAPKKLSYKVIKSFPHDTSAYTEGLSFVDGKLLESTGEKGKSKLKYVALETGKTIKSANLSPEYFGEGSVKIGNQIIWLTWQENLGFVFDANTLKQIKTFPYEQSREGWGLTFDGNQILRSDGSNRIWKMNAKTLKEEGYIEVYDDKGPVNQLNELEFIGGKIFANVFTTNRVVIINPKNGVVEKDIDLTALAPKSYFKTETEIQNNVLNGIAYDAKQNRIFITGKKWPRVYQLAILD